MRVEQRTQIRKILDYKSATAKRELEKRRADIYGDHSAKGCLQSGGTIRAVIRIMEEVGAALVTDSIEQVSAVAQDIEAFAALTAGFDDFWNYLANELQSTINLAGGRHPMESVSDSASRSATLLFDKSRGLVRQKLELYRFAFTNPVPNTPSSPNPAESTQPSSQYPPKAKGGRPLAEHWDDMWAAIAVALYTGQLIPKNQAGIEGAMLAWLEANGHSAANSTVRGRARRLWDRIEGEN